MIWLYWLRYVFLLALVAAVLWLTYLARVADHE